MSEFPLEQEIRLELPGEYPEKHKALHLYLITNIIFLKISQPLIDLILFLIQKWLIAYPECL